MDWLPSAVCLFLALVMLVAAFALLAVGQPEASLQLHQVRVSGDEEQRRVLEQELAGRQFRRRLTMVALFIGAGGMTVAAFFVMRPRDQRQAS